ncbi:hypothetical protein Mar181_2474 [Marinomonas posidonica IVIA-Po-181]|uniref:Pesticin C-terminal domain-containing protein n=2 Tax=Marinomonas TaxID=28253 RepID=F6CWU5_MARPP|nr:hypothetical protein Mar181_2474 [Marinomonas posidonica IVIA-Po-181]
MQDASSLGLPKEVWNWWPIHSFDDEMDEKWLTVPKGQLTFDSEGTDVESSFMFTRKPHVPNNSGNVIEDSGITIGRGFDIGNKPASEVEQYFNAAAVSCKPISPKLLDWLKKGAGKTKQAAYDYWLTLDAKVPKEEQEITRKMQHYLFLESYAFYENDAKRLTTKLDVRNAYIDGAELNWDELSEKVREVITDLRYVGHYTGSGDKRGNTRKKIVPAIYKDLKESLSGDSSNLYEIMTNKVMWLTKFNVDENRFDARGINLK